MPHPRTIDRAAAWAGFNGWTLLICAAISIVVSRSLTSIVFTALFAGLGLRELRGRALMKKHDSRAPLLLATNQILLAVIIVGYCLWKIIMLKLHPDIYLSNLDRYPQLEQSLRQQGVDFNQLILQMTIVAYSAVAGASFILQLFMALYYWTRKKYLPSKPAPQAQ